jgi:ketosteroid isomerase-like protein
VSRRVLGLGLGLLLLAAVPNVRAQEAEVSAAVSATLAAWAEGEYETFVGFYHPDARGFFLDGGALMQGFSTPALQAMAQAGFEANVQVRDLDVKMYGSMAVSVAYVEGALTLPGGLVLEGTWRYSETRVETDGGWKVVQFHMSPQQSGL